MEVVRKIKSWFSIKRAGHIGTLDPFATGVLPVVLNEGRRIVPFLKEEPKEYEAEMKLGEETTTDDFTGKLLSQKSLNGITPEKIYHVFNTFVGKIKQVPPVFSAVKIEGIPLYRWARKGIEKERQEKTIEIFKLEIQEISLPKIRFNLLCSKGTYVRALARDIGRRLGCGGHLISLRRLRSGSFHLGQAISMEELRRLSPKESLSHWVISPEEALSDIPEVKANERMIRKITQGQGIALKDLWEQSLPDFRKGQELRMSSSEGKLLAILRSERDREEIYRTGSEEAIFRPLRVLSKRVSGMDKKKVICEGGIS